MFFGVILLLRFYHYNVDYGLWFFQLRVAHSRGRRRGLSYPSGTDFCTRLRAFVRDEISLCSFIQWFYRDKVVS
jgi:hypothetical protein